MEQESTPSRERHVAYAMRQRRVICAPADPQPQESPPESGQPHVPHGDEIEIEESDIVSVTAR